MNQSSRPRRFRPYNICLYLLLLGVQCRAVCQEISLPGYIVWHANDTIHGYIQWQWSRPAGTSIRFKSNRSGSVVSYDVDSIEGFCLTGLESFASESITRYSVERSHQPGIWKLTFAPPTRVFLKKLEDGPVAMLYELPGDKPTYYYGLAANVHHLDPLIYLQVPTQNDSNRFETGDSMQFQRESATEYFGFRFALAPLVRFDSVLLDQLLTMSLNKKNILALFTALNNQENRSPRADTPPKGMGTVLFPRSRNSWP
ncbi:MAG: hypothetical protein P4L51_23615 [Puia sp.]|nr:hypothetical protein [Puia sp.]